jgi:hypothetical protein
MKRGTCKHFNSTWRNKSCEAGVCYADVTPDNKNESGVAYRIPCRIIEGEEYNKLNDVQKENYQKRGTCNKFEEPTDEELEEYQNFIDAAMKRHMLVFPIIAEIKKAHKRKNWRGDVTCPVCNRKLHISHAASNGHVWGKCETDGCLSWME